MLVRMSRIQIIGARPVLDRTVRALHCAGVAQIEERLPTMEPLALDADTTRQRDEIRQLLTRLDSLLALLPQRPLSKNIPALYEAQAARPTGHVIADVKDAVTQLDAPAQDLARRRDQLEADRVTLPRYAKTMRQLMPLAAELTPLKNYETVALLVQRKYGAVFGVLRQQLLALTNEECEIVSREIDAETTAAILVFPRAHSAAVHTMLGRESIAQVRLPEELTNVPFKDQLATIEARLAAIPLERDRILHELDTLAEEWRLQLSVWSAILRDRLQELEVCGRFGATHYTFIVVGWMPQKELSALRDALAREVGDEIVLEELPLTEREREQAPVVLSNPRPARPFEFLVRVMAKPRYGSIDPTPIMAIFLPVFFGMILGDVAYGAIVLLAAWYLWRRAKSNAFKSVSLVILYCAAWSVGFGFLYGELFGELGRRWFGMPAYFPRGEAVMALFAFSLAFGVVHVSLGFALGIYQAIKLHQRHELLDRIAKVIALIGVFAMAAAGKNVLPREMFTTGLALVLVGTALLMYTLGWAGLLLAPIEILGVLGNILSYLRLAAIGLASVYLALVANKLAGIFGNVVLGIIVAALFHALNIAMGILSPTIQSLRLHYVEFFPKFFEGGGGDFKPFRREGFSP